MGKVAQFFQTSTNLNLHHLTSEFSRLLPTGVLLEAPKGSRETLYRGSIGAMEKLRIWGLGVWRATCIVNLNQRAAQKLRRIIVLHFGLVTFNSHFPQIPQNFMFMIF